MSKPAVLQLRALIAADPEKGAALTPLPLR